jgi:hypothetical protein
VRRALARGFSRTAFWVWAALSFVAASSLTAAHLYALPKPARTDLVLVHALNALRADGDGGLLAVHVLYARCRCSARILQHLAAEPRPAGVTEKLLLVGSNPELEPELLVLAARKVQVVETSAIELRDRYHVQAAPLFLVLGRDGRLLYSGGYTQRKQGAVFEDTAILRKLAADENVIELPLFGCALSRDLQRLLDPFALRGRTP